MPVIRFNGNAGQSANKTSQQVSAPTTKLPSSVKLDNELQLDQSVRNLQQISQNIVIDSSKIQDSGKNLFFTSGQFKVESVSPIEQAVSIFQGSNYSVLSPNTNTIKVEGYGKVLIFENIEFYLAGSSFPLLTIYEDSKVMFKNCVFRKDNNIQNPNDCYILIQDPSRVSFVGCWFCGTQTNGSVINNTGVAADVSVNGGFNTTTINHINTTIFGELT